MTDFSTNSRVFVLLSKTTLTLAGTSSNAQAHAAAMTFFSFFHTGLRQARLDRDLTGDKP